MNTSSKKGGRTEKVKKFNSAVRLLNLKISFPKTFMCNKKHKTEAEEKMRGKSEPLNDWKETLCLCVVCGESQSLHFDMERARKRNRAGNLNDFFVLWRETTILHFTLLSLK